MKTLKNILAYTAVILACASCQDRMKHSISSTAIKANIHTSDQVQTRTSSDESGLVATLKGNFAEVEIYDTPGICAANAPATRGDILTNDTFTSAKVDAYLAKTVSGLDQHYINKGDIYYSGDVTSPSGDSYLWVNEVKMHMWCYLPEDLGMTMDASGNASFAYTTPASLSAQEDILVSHNEEFYDDNASDVVDVTLHHALAAARFDIRLVPAGYKVTKAEFIGIRNAGTCAVQADGRPLWTPGAGTATISHTDAEGLLATATTFPKTSDGLFFFMPQDLPDGARLALSVQDGDGKTASDTISIAGKTFAAGHTYTIRIKAAVDKKVEIQGDWLKFTGKNDQYILFQSLDLLSGTTMSLSFDFLYGNDHKAMHRLRIVKAGEKDSDGKVIYYRGGYEEKIFQSPNAPATGESCTAIHLTKTDGIELIDGAFGSGHCEMTFTMPDFEGPYDIIFDYKGGNAGNAKWYLTNLDLEITNIQ